MPQRHLLGAFGEHPLTALRLPAAVAALAPDHLQRPMSHWQILDPRLAHVERAPAHQHPAPRAAVLVGRLHHHHPPHVRRHLAHTTRPETLAGPTTTT